MVIEMLLIFDMCNVHYELSVRCSAEMLRDIHDGPLVSFCRFLSLTSIGFHGVFLVRDPQLVSSEVDYFL